MKPIKLTMTAFGPYKDATVIEFEKFRENGLFLICGDTGAGKTTVFDGITYALYDTPSGSNRKSEMLRSDYAQSDVATRLELIFEHKREQYKVVRTLKYLKDNGKLQNAEAALIFPDERVVTGQTRVTKAIEELLGVDYEQFKQISMIPQGEFLNLLIESSANRGTIFRKVFNTSKYSDLADILKVKASIVREKESRLKERQLQFLEGLQVREESAYFETLRDYVKNYSEYETEEVMKTIELLIKEDKEADQVNKKTEEKLEKENIKLLKALNQIRNTNEKLTKLEHLKLEKENLEQDKPAMEKRRQELAITQNILKYIKPIESLKERMESEVKNMQNKITVCSQKKEELEEEFAHIKKEQERFEAKKDTLELLKEEIIRLHKEIVKCEELETLQTKRKQHVDISVKIENEMQALVKNEETLTLHISQNKERILALEDTEIHLVMVQAKEKEEILIMEKTAENLKELNALEGLLQNLSHLQSDCLNAANSYSRKSIEYERYKVQFFAEQAGILASRLEENKPCPVCGSLNHPEKALLTGVHMNENQLIALEKEKDEYNLLVQKASEKAKLEKQKYENNFDNIWNNTLAICKIRETKTQEDKSQYLRKLLQSHMNTARERHNEHLEEMKDLEKKLQEKISLKSMVERQQVELSQMQETIRSKKQQQKQAEITGSMLVIQIETIKKDLEFETTEQIQKKIAGNTRLVSALNREMEHLDKKFTRISNDRALNRSILEENQKQLPIRLAELKMQEAEYRKVMKKWGIAGKEEYTLHLLSEEKLNEKEKLVEKYYMNLQKKETMIQTLLDETKGKSRESEEIYTEKLSEVMTNKKEITNRRKKIFSRTENNTVIYRQIRAIDRERSDSLEYNAAIKSLADTANGTLSKKAKVTFERYVQVVYFRMIVAEANKRLEVMTGGQYELLVKEEDTNKRNQIGLELDVHDYHTGKARTVKSLSGGESFQAALALALGLSDVIQSFAGGIEVETMFIDEGFGALDAESLEQAVSILHTLTHGNRLVGIISHVTELRERIENQIIIKKGKRGSELL